MTPDQFVLSGGSPVGLTCCAATSPMAATLMKKVCLTAGVDSEGREHESCYLAGEGTVNRAFLSFVFKSSGGWIKIKLKG